MTVHCSEPALNATDAPSASVAIRSAGLDPLLEIVALVVEA